MGLDDEIRYLEETENKYKCLFFGDPGGGKSTLAAGAPDPIWFDFERSTDTLRYDANSKRIPVVRPLSIEGANDRNRWSKYEKLVKEAVTDDRFGTIVIDTLGGQARICENEVCAAQGKDLPDWPVWRKVLDIQTDFLNFLQDCDKHVIYIAHAVTKQNDLTQEIEIRTNLTPGMSEVVYRTVSLVGYLEVETSRKGETTRRLLVTAGGKQQAKNRLGIKDAYIDDPTFDKLLNAAKRTT